MEDPSDYIDNVISEDNINVSINYLLKILNAKKKYTLKMEKNTDLFDEWLNESQKFVAFKWEKDKEVISKLENMIKKYKNKTREHERSLWSTSSNAKDDATWIKKLENKNRRIDLLKKRLFMTKLDEDYQPIEGIDNFIFMLSLDSATRQILELEQEIAFLKDIEKDMMKDGAMTDKNTSEDDPSWSKIKPTIDFMSFFTIFNYATEEEPSLEYLSNVLVMQNRKINRLLEIKNIFTSINNMSNEQDVLKCLKMLSKKVNKYVSTLQMQMFYSSKDLLPSILNLEFLNIDKLLKVFETTFPQYYDEVPCARMLDKGKCRIAELENQYIQLTEKPRIPTQNHIAILEKNLATRKTEIEITRRRPEKWVEKHENELVILLDEKKTSTIKDESDEEKIQYFDETYEEKIKMYEDVKNTNILLDEKKTSIIKKKKTGKNKKQKEEVHAEMDDVSDEEEIQYFDETYEEKIKMYEDVKNKKCKSRNRLQKQRNDIWRMKCEIIQLRDENLQLERKFEMNENMLKELLLSKDIDKMISRQAKMSAKITSEKQDNFELNKDKFFTDKQILYNFIEKTSRVQTALRGGNRYHDYLLKNYALAKDVLLKEQEKKNFSTNPIRCSSCKLFDEKLKHATNVISTISAQMVKTRELFHMLPFKKFLKTILQYMMTKRKVEPKRSKLRFEREIRGKQAKREKRVKQTNERTKPTETSETSETKSAKKQKTKKQKTLDLLSDEYIDSLVAKINSIVVTKDDCLSCKSTEQEHEPKRDIIKENLGDEDNVFKIAHEIVEMMNSFKIEDNEMIHKIYNFNLNWHNTFL